MKIDSKYSTSPLRLLSLAQRYRSFVFLATSAVFTASLLFPTAGCAQVFQYEYRLEKSSDDELCPHMTEVFNQRFQTLWEKGYLPQGKNPMTLFGKSFDQVFERLPGVEYNKRFVWDMLYTKYPSLPEFDAVVWKEGRYYDSDESAGAKGQPILITQIDIDNDGKMDWIVKYSFMFKMPTNEVYGNARDHDYFGQDYLAIFPNDGFDVATPLMLRQLTRGQKPDYPSRLIGDNSGLQFRPFIFKGRVYLAAYQVVWYDKKIHKKRPKDYRLYPDHEHLNVLRVLPPNKKSMEVTINAATETICRIRMNLHLAYNALPLKGN